jgi:hypothetical protein
MEWIERNLKNPHKNWFFRRQPVYANLDLYRVPYYKIDRISQMDSMKDGFVAFDEMWTVLNSRASLSQKNKIVNGIILRSRKRNLNYTQTVRNDSLVNFCYANAWTMRQKSKVIDSPSMAICS